MSNRSMTDLIAVLQQINGTQTATQTPSTGVDVQGYTEVEAVVDIGVVTNIANSPQPSWTFTLQHSDAAGSGFAAVADGDVVIPDGQDAISSGLFATVDAAADDAAVYRVGYVGNKRYLRVVATAANTPGNTPICVNYVCRKALAV